MKVLCLTLERADANAVAAALHGTVPGAATTWTARFEDAARWVFGNPDVSAIILDAQLGADVCGAFMDRLRRRGFTAPSILLVSVNHESARAPALGERDSVLVRAEFLHGLPATLLHVLGVLETPVALTPVPAVAPSPAAVPGPTAPTDESLVRKLAETEAALERSERAREADIASAAAQLARRTHAFATTAGDLLKARDTAERALRATQQQLSDLQAEASRAAADRAAFAARIAEAEDAAARARQAHGDVAAEARRLAERESALQSELAELSRLNAALDNQLSAAARERQEAEATVARDRRAEAERVARQQAELAAQRDAAESARQQLRDELTSVASARDALERRLAETEAAVDAQRRTAIELRGEVERGRREADERLAEAEAVRCADHADHAAVLFAATADFAQRQAHSEQQIAAVTADHAASRQRLADVEAALAASELQARRDREVAVRDAAQRDESAAAREAALHEQHRRAVEQLTREQASAVFAAAADFAERYAALERRLADALAAAADRLAQRERELGEQLAAAGREQRDAEARVAERESGLRARAAEIAAVADTLAAALADARVALETERSASAQLRHDVARVRAEAEERLREAAAALAAAKARAAQEQVNVAERAASREALLRDQLETTSDAKTALQARLANVETSLAAERERRDRSEADAARVRTEADDRLARSEERLTAALAAAAAQLQRREDELGAQLARRERELSAEIDRRLQEAEAAFTTARDLAGRKARIAAEQAARRDLELTGRLADLSAAKTAVDQRLAEVQAALATERASLAAERATATRLREDAERGQQAAAEQLNESERRLAAAAAAAAAQLAQREHELAAERDRQLAEAHSVLDAALARAAAERDAAARDASRSDDELRAQLAGAVAANQELESRQSDLWAEFEQTVTERRGLESRLAAADAALTSAHEAVAARDRQLEAGRVREAELTALLATAAAAHHALDAQRLASERSRLETEARATRELADAGDQLMALEARLGNEVALRESLEHERDLLQRSFDESRQADDQRGSAHAAVVGALEAAAAEREKNLADLAAQLAALEQAAEHEVARLRGVLDAAAAAHARDIDQHRSDHRSLLQRLVTLTNQRDAAHEQAGQVPLLREQLRQLHAESSRAFDEHPRPLCRCTRDGLPRQTNRALTALLGFRPDEERRAVEFAAAQFASSGDVAWLSARCVQGAAESVECAWRNVQGGRLIVRLFAIPTADGIDLVVDDLTVSRTLDERIARTRRMESVGRVAADVSAACLHLLDGMHQDDDDRPTGRVTHPDERRRAEARTSDLARLRSLLGRLDAYAGEQAGALEPVDLHRVLRDLEPVLKEIGGDDVDIVLPKRPSRWSPPILVDVKLDRVERVLITAAGYARARMPLGGTMALEVEETVVAQPFIERHPAARPGPHALLTITETRGAIRSITRATPGGRAADHPDPTAGGGADPGGRADEAPVEAGADLGDSVEALPEVNDGTCPPDAPGVDLGPLQQLVHTSGGHLWVEASPPGDIVLRIHLPLRTPDERRWPSFGLAAFRTGAL